MFEVFDLFRKSRKVMIIIGITLGIFLVVLILLVCNGLIVRKNPDKKNMVDNTTVTASNELIGVFDSEAEALQVAEQYGITLKSYSNRVATYTVVGSVSDVMREGTELGLPTLYINREYSGHDN